MFLILSKLLELIIKTAYTLSGDRLPQFVSVCVIIQDDKGKFLVQNRADKKGFCLPGGLTKAGEKLEECAIREVFEETGIKVKNCKFLYLKDVDSLYKYSLTAVFKADIESGELKDSWEGRAYWKEFSQIKTKMAFDQEKIVEKFLNH